jgi:hypothetical protein
MASFHKFGPSFDLAHEVVAESQVAGVAARLFWIYDPQGMAPDSGIVVSLVNINDRDAELASCTDFADLDQARLAAAQMVAEREADYLAEAADPIASSLKRLPALFS